MTATYLALAGALSIAGSVLLDKAERKESVPSLIAGMVGITASVMLIAWETIGKMF